MSIYKERRTVVDRKPLPPPIVEDITGTFFIGTFALEEGKGGRQEACGRSPKELFDRIRAKLEESEPESKGKRIPNISITFVNKVCSAMRTLVGMESRFDMSVRTEGLEGGEINEVFRALEHVLDGHAG
jgi:hypothetical protein